MTEPKYCPLLTIANAIYGSGSCMDCQEERCAWYVPPTSARQEGRCAVQFLGALPELKR